MSEDSPPQLDDRSVAEWFELGWGELTRYLRLWARFERWCEEHGRP